MFTSGAVTALCDRLEQKGFAFRRKGKDRREVLLHITDKGREMFIRNQNIGRRCITVLFDGFSEEELGVQIMAYQKVFNNLGHFADKIIGLANENAERAKSAKQIEMDKQDYQKSNFWTY